MEQQDPTVRSRRLKLVSTVEPLASVDVAMSALTAEVVHREVDLVALRPAWEDLFRAAGADRGASLDPFVSWSWMWHWWRSRSLMSRFAQPRYALHVLVLRDQRGVVRVIVPFVRARWGVGRLSVRAIRMFGFGPTTADLRSPLVWPGWEPQAADAIGEALRPRGTRRMDLSILDGVPDVGPLTQRLSAQASDAGWTWGPSVPTHQLALPEAWEPFRRSFDGHLKKSVRHGYNSLKREGHHWAFDAVSDPAGIADALEDVFRLHAARAARTITPRHVDYYAHPADRAAMRDIVATLAADGHASVCRLRVSGSVVAARIVFEGEGAVYLHDAGADPAWSRYAVATTLTAECLRWAIERGATVAHLGTGDDPSKRRWRGRERSLRRLEVVAPTLAGRILEGAQRLRRWTRDLSMAMVPLAEDLPVWLLA